MTPKPKMGRPRNPNRRAAVKMYLTTKLTVRAVAQKIGVHRATVGWWLRDAGGKIDYSRIARYCQSRRENIPEILQRYKAGHTLADLGLVFGISKQRVHQLLKREGVPRRNKHWRKAKVKA